jgi:hypothetical protein
VGENRRHSRRLGWGPPVSGPQFLAFRLFAGRVSGAGLCWRFSNFRFGGAKTGSTADRDWFADTVSGILAAATDRDPIIAQLGDERKDRCRSKLQ